MITEVGFENMPELIYLHTLLSVHFLFKTLVNRFQANFFPFHTI
jgi:hypothetical protein